MEQLTAKQLSTLQWALVVALLASVLALTACRKHDRAEPAAAFTNALSLEAQLEEADRAVWHGEVLAREHERTMTELADRLRRARDKSAVLAEWPFKSIALPGRLGAPDAFPIGIQRQRFDDTKLLHLSHDQWRAALSQFARAGWKLVQFEWQHERFTPRDGTNGAVSDFTFELHGEQSAETNRFIVRGRLAIHWEPSGVAGNLVVRELQLLERAGRAPFSNHLILAPEPDRPGGQVNLHPVIVTDINRDLHDDIVLPGVNKALLNDGRANFRPVTLIEELHFNPVQPAGVVADFDRDGHADYLGVAELGSAARMLVLYRGNSAPPFRGAPHVAWAAQRAQFSELKITHASVITAGDVDHDGDLDVFVAQYRPPYVGGQLPTPYYDANDGFASHLLLNDGRGSFFEAENQPALRAKSHRRTLSASLVDLDGDDDLDLVTLNDYSGVDLFYNDGKGHFSDETARVDNRHLFGMGLALADFDHDGALEVLATGMNIPTVHRLNGMGLAPQAFPERTARRMDMAHGNRLYVHRGGRWVQPPWATQLAESGWTWGVGALDIDNNGSLDVYAANGHVSGASSADYDTFCWTRDIYLGTAREDASLQRYFEAALRGLNSGQTSWAGFQHNRLFLDRGSNEYIGTAFLAGLAHESDCRAVVSADFNEDGRPDLVLTEALWQGTPNLMRHRLLVHLNETQTPHHWIGVRLSRTNGPVIGTKVIAIREDGRHVAQVLTGDSFQSQAPAAIHFGLGQHPRVTLQVLWPDGTLAAMTNAAIDRWHTFER